MRKYYFCYPEVLNNGEIIIQTADCMTKTSIDLLFKVFIYLYLKNTTRSKL